MTQPDLFGDTAFRRDGVALLPGFARDRSAEIAAAVDAVAAVAPFRHMTTPGGHAMSVAMTNCGAVGWVTDRKGYRYQPMDPLTGSPWPAMPKVIFETAVAAARLAGFEDFAPDACLINRYEPGARMGLHQDINEWDAAAPVVSLSFGLPAVFMFGGQQRTDRVDRLPLHHGDVVVWGGPARRAFHGIAPLKDGLHPQLGRQRLNLTVRRAQ